MQRLTLRLFSISIIAFLNSVTLSAEEPSTSAEKTLTNVAASPAGSDLFESLKNNDAGIGKTFDNSDLNGPESESTPKRDAIRKPLTLLADHLFSAGIAGQQGSLSVSRVGSIVSGGIPITSKAVLLPSFTYTRTEYNFSDTTGINRDPFGDVNYLSVSLSVPIQWNERWSTFFSTSTNLSYEDGARLNNSFTYAFIAGLNYKWTDEWDVGAGAVAVTLLNGSPFAIGFPTFAYRPAYAPKWEFEFGTRGPSASILYKFGEVGKMSLSAGYAASAFRLSKDGPIPDGSVTEGSAFLESRLFWRPVHWLLLEPAVGVRLSRSYQVFSEGDRKLEVIDVNPAGYLGCFASIVW